jgi:hypothetical protein
MMLVIRTQIYENYGAHNWDGTGDCPQYWKAKGGTEYKIIGIPLNIDFEDVVSIAAVERNNDYIQETMIDWSVESDDYLSWFEKSQLEYDGEIQFPEPKIEYSDLVMESM